MSRLCSVTLLISSLFALAARGDDRVVAPYPREIRPDGPRQPVPEATVAPAKDSRETVERIIKNSKDVGDRLAATDTGSDTRKTQASILKDIESLIQQEENPPNPQSGQDPENNQKKKDQKEDSSKGGQKKDGDGKSNGMPMPGDMGNMNGMPPPNSKGQGSGKNQQPMGEIDHPTTRKPRQQSGEQQKEQESRKEPDKKGVGNQARNQGEQPKKGNSPAANPSDMMPGVPSLPAIPPEETNVKDVWGYLPDKLRQQAMQYYKQDFMPRYAKLLEHYYSSLAEKNARKP